MLIDLAEGRGRADRSVYSETLYPLLHLGWSQLRSLTIISWRQHLLSRGPAPELFDIAADPHEKNNVRERSSVMHAWRARTVAPQFCSQPPASVQPMREARLLALPVFRSGHKRRCQ